MAEASARPAPVDLPPALRAWATELAWLEPRLALGLGPALQRLDLLLAGATPIAGEGEPDGYDGFSRRGTLDRLSLTEWLLAADVPDELVRRAATNELSYLEPATRGGPQLGRVAVVVDAGPSQLGGPRLGQLAALIVLARRAAAAGAGLAVGVLGDPAGLWVQGDLPEVLQTWLRSRRPNCPTEEDALAWARTLADGDEGWLFTGRELAAVAGLGRLRAVSFEDGAWSDAGLLSLEVRARGGQARLPLPSTHLAVRALRGSGLLRRQEVATSAPEGLELRCPTLPAPVRRLLCRGRTPDELVTVSLPSRAGDEGGRPRLHRFPGPVIAASFVGSRLVAVVAVGDDAHVHVVGKPLGGLGQAAFSLSGMGLDQQLVLAMDLDGSPLGGVLYSSGDLLASIAGAWWRLPAIGVALLEPVVAAGHGPAGDVPITARWRGEELVVGGVAAPGASRPAPSVVFGGVHGFAYAVSGTRWRIVGHQRPPVDVDVDKGVVMLGLVTVEDHLWLVLRSPGGHIFRMARAAAERTLTSLSGEPGTLSVHPRHPLVAAGRPDGSVEVVDLSSNETLLRLRGTG